MDINNKLTARKLNKIFDVRGSYYTLRYPGGTILGCRNSLEIYTKNSTNQPIEGTLPDALFVMMNPGGSRPWDKKYVSPVYTPKQIMQMGG